jgi:hypothetical protein
MSSEDSSSSSGPAKAPIDPVIRNAMRYSLSPREYQLLHKYLLSRAPVVRNSAPRPASYKKVVEESDDYNASTVRLSLRLFGSSYAALKLWEFLAPRIFAGGKPIPYELFYSIRSTYHH